MKAGASREGRVVFLESVTGEAPHLRGIRMVDAIYKSLINKVHERRARDQTEQDAMKWFKFGGSERQAYLGPT